MARRRLLTREALAPHYDPPTDEREIARHFTLCREDLNLVCERRGASSRLGFAMLLLYMRWPGRVLEAGERPPGAILTFVADQIDVPATAFDDYARRDETRRAHIADLMQRFGNTALDRHHFRAIVAFAMPVAQTVAQPLLLAGTVIEAIGRAASFPLPRFPTHGDGAGRLGLYVRGIEGCTGDGVPRATARSARQLCPMAAPNGGASPDRTGAHTGAPTPDEAAHSAPIASSCSLPDNDRSSPPSCATMPIASSPDGSIRRDRVRLSRWAAN
ncbi:MAG: DUF4158 domain-containing protein [Sphingomonas sp.]|jgi:hypothetical protein|nr:DUF4158 domain-containing protein [Sphingomonas sp.]